MPGKPDPRLDFAHWQRPWLALGVRCADAALHAQLLQCYSEPQRHYHNCSHIAECLNHFDALRHLAQSPELVELALWFHDAIYLPRQHDNEERSAAWARAALLSALRSTAGGPQSAQTVHDLILATRHTSAVPQGDAALLCDIDLAILAANRERFAEYAQQIRAEYAWVDAATYHTERSRILAQFLARPRLYHTEPGHTLWDAAARRNLHAALQPPPSAGEDFPDRRR